MGPQSGLHRRRLALVEAAIPLPATSEASMKTYTAPKRRNIVHLLNRLRNTPTAIRRTTRQTVSRTW
jgi:hypothetical protein